MNRRTSAYALRINVPTHEGWASALDAAAQALPEGVVVTDQHVRRRPLGAYLSVGFRAADDNTAVAIAETTLARFHGDRPHAGAELLTGHGVHRRSVWEVTR